MKAELLSIGWTDPHERIVWRCPGCKCNHGVPVPPHRLAWDWNTSLDAPTLHPSVLITYNGADAGKPGALPARCHCFIHDGQIKFLGDCTHELAGKTVPMEEVE